MSESTPVQSNLFVESVARNDEIAAGDSGQLECVLCERMSREDRGKELANGDWICEACATDYYFECARCARDERCEDGHETEHETRVCNRCARLHYTYSGLQGCYVEDDESVRLEDSGAVVSVSWAESNAYSHDGDWYECEENLPRDDALHDYSTDVLDYCDYDKEALERGALMFGVELEMEPAGDTSQDELADELGGRTCREYILKEDASLDAGVELVTIPLSLEGHRDRFAWRRVLSSVQGHAKSGAGTTNCGMHVHINKAALSSLQIGKMQVFLNSTSLRDQITTIAQRASNDFCERSAKKVTDGAKFSANRHDIMNVGSRTVEMRMFRGNLNFKRVLKNIEFCHALVLYCKDASLRGIEDWGQFASWLLRRRSQYPHLVEFLVDSAAPGFAGAIRVRKDKGLEDVACA